MRLYKELEVHQLALAKAKRLHYEAEHGEEIAAEKLALAKACKEQASKTVKSFSKRPICIQPGAVQLPLDVLEVILMKLVDHQEPEGVWGVSLVARDLANAACASWDLYAASRCAWTALARAAPLMNRAMPGPLPWATWDSLVQQPCTLKQPELKVAARMLNLPVGGTKPQLILRLYNAFELEEPTWLPARLCMALVEDTTPLDVRRMVRHLANAGDAVAAEAKAAKGADTRRIIASKYSSMKDLLLAFVEVPEDRPERCRCGNMPKRGCETGMCGLCCPSAGCAAHAPYFRG